MYFWLFWLLISCVPTLFYCSNICGYIDYILKYQFFVASLSQVDKIVL